jgi:hypothetical protein
MSDLDQYGWPTTDSVLAKERKKHAAEIERLERKLAEALDQVEDLAKLAEQRAQELAEARQWIDAVMECSGDTWECPRCGHSEPWWEDSNAEYGTGERDKRLAAKESAR